VPLLEMIRGALDTKTDAGDAVALKALHSGALALSRQRRALRRKAAASPAGRHAAEQGASAAAHALSLQPGVAEISMAEARESQQEHAAEALQERHSFAASPLQSPSSWPSFSLAESRGDVQKDFKASFEAEAKHLGRAHRSMCSRAKASRGKPCGPTPDAALAEPLAKESSSEVSMEQPVPAPPTNINVCSVCGQTCPVCGGPDPLRSGAATRTNEEQVLAARLEMAETLLARAGQDAARAVALERELAAERARSADLAEALKGTRSLACALHDGLEETTQQLEIFMAKVRLTAEAADETIGEVKGAAEALLDFRPGCDYQEQEALAESLRRDDGRLHELAAKVHRLHSELDVEKEHANEQRRMVQRASNAELSLQQRLQLEAVAARHEMQEQLREESTQAHRHHRQSTLLDLSVRQTEAEVDAAYRQLQESRAELQQSRHEEREMEVCIRRKHHELQHTREEFSTSEQELAVALESTAKLRSSIQQHNRRSGVLQAAVATEVQDAVAVVHRESPLLMMADPRQPARRQRAANAARHWQNVTVRVSMVPAPTLHWKQPSHSRFRRAKTGSFSLQDVVSVDYGQGLKPDTQPPEKPGNCFALRSASFTHFFWSSDDATVEAFVVGLSRLCPRAPPVRGRDFRMRQTLARVGETRQARASALLAAVRRAAPEPTPVIYVSDPDGARQVISPVSFSGSAQPASSSAGNQQVGDPGGGAEAFSPVSFGGSAQAASSSSGQQQGVFQPAAQGSSTSSASRFPFAGAVAADNRSSDEAGQDAADGESAGEAADPEDHEGVPIEDLEEEEGEEEPGDQEWYEESQSSTRPGSTRSGSSFPPDDDQRGVSGASASATE